MKLSKEHCNLPLISPNCFFTASPLKKVFVHLVVNPFPHQGGLLTPSDLSSLEHE